MLTTPELVVTLTGLLKAFAKCSGERRKTQCAETCRGRWGEGAVISTESARSRQLLPSSQVKGLDLHA